LNDAGEDCGGLSAGVSTGGGVVVEGVTTGAGELGAGATIVTHAMASMTNNNILISAFFTGSLLWLSAIYGVILSVPCAV